MRGPYTNTSPRATGNSRPEISREIRGSSSWELVSLTGLPLVSLLPWHLQHAKSVAYLKVQVRAFLQVGPE